MPSVDEWCRPAQTTYRPRPCTGLYRVQRTRRADTHCVRRTPRIGPHRAHPALAQAIRDAFTDTRALLEPAGAISIAGLCKWKAKAAAHEAGYGGSYVAIASDACNIEFDFLKEFASEATSGATFVRIGERMGTRPPSS